MSAGRLLTLGLGTPFSSVGFLVTLGLGTSAPPPPVPAGIVSGYPTPVRNWEEEERARKKKWDSEGARRAALRSLIRKSMGLPDDSPPVPAAVAIEVRTAAAPFVERKRERLTIDWQALERTRSVLSLLERLAWEARERARIQALHEDDEETMMMVLQ